MSGNKLALNRYNHDAFVPNSNGAASYLVKKFQDDITEFDAGAEAKYQHNSIRINPQSAPSNIYNGSAQQIDFQINRNEVLCHYDKIQLYFTLANTGAALGTILASHFLIDYIEVLIGGGAVENIYAHHLLYNELYLADDDEHVYNNRAVRFFTGGIAGTTYTSGGTIAAGASRTFYIEIPCALSKTECFIPAIEQTITFRVHFPATALTSGSLATTMTLTQADLFIHGRDYNSAIKQKLLARYKTYDHVMPYYEPIRSIMSGQTISAVTKSNVLMSNFGGMLSSQVVVMLVPSAAVQESLYNFAALSKLDILRNGYTISSFQDQPADWIKQQMATLFNTTAVATQNIYVIPQSNTPVESADLGIQRGAVFLTNNDILEIQAVAGAAYDVYVLTYRFCNVTISKNGQFLLTPVTNTGN